MRDLLPDNCELVPNAEQEDTDEDGVGDACDATATGTASETRATTA